jgi:hypothetical protein
LNTPVCLHRPLGRFVAELHSRTAYAKGSVSHGHDAAPVSPTSSDPVVTALRALEPAPVATANAGVAPGLHAPYAALLPLAVEVAALRERLGRLERQQAVRLRERDR